MRAAARNDSGEGCRHTLDDGVCCKCASLRSDADDPFNTLTRAFDELFRASGLEEFMGQIVKRVAKVQGDYVQRVTKIPPGQVATQQTIEEFRRRNVALITNLRDEHVTAVSDILRAATASGARHEDVAPEIADRLGVGFSRAKLIARDQTNKINSQMAQASAASAGIEEYTWGTAKDENVRPDHKRLQGRRFRYDDPPVTDQRTGRRNNPGEDIQCRCVAIPVIPLFDGI